jgi:hypothetical protein
MTIIANTETTYVGIGNRELLLDTIYNIAPAETPVLTNASKVTLNRELIDWQTDTLRAAAANAQLEGDDSPAFPAFVPTVRIRNFAQISRELVIVSGTQDIVNKAGRGSDLAYKVAQGSMALKRDLEFNMLSNVLPNAGAAATARVSTGLPDYIATNTSKGGGAGADPVYTTTAGITTVTTLVVDGTQRPMTETLLRTVLQLIYTQGGNPSTIMCGPTTKQTISTFGGVATKTFYQDAAAPSVIVSAADVYVSDYSKLAVIPNRFIRQVSSNFNDCFVLDWDLLAVGFLREFQVQELAKTGDAEKRQLIAEWSLVVKNEKGLGIVRDLNN